MDSFQFMWLNQVLPDLSDILLCLALVDDEDKCWPGNMGMDRSLSSAPDLHRDCWTHWAAVVAVYVNDPPYNPLDI